MKLFLSNILYFYSLIVIITLIIYIEIKYNTYILFPINYHYQCTLNNCFIKNVGIYLQ